MQVGEEQVDVFCETELGSGVGETLFRAASVGEVVGVRLCDGRQVVVKAHQPRETPELLEAVQRVQRHLYEAGFPCPRPLAGPAPLLDRLATAEEYVVTGEFQDTHEPRLRRLMAETLAWHLELTRGIEPLPALRGGWSIYAADRLWPEQAHSPLFDLEASAPGAEWIDAIAAKAKALATKPSEPVVGHTDWSGKHFRFARDRVTVVYDWDSLRLVGEAQIVGNAAMTFTTNFELCGVERAPSPDELRAFLDEYDSARVTPLTRAEREQVAACATFIAAYTARCEHCLRPTEGDEPGSFTTALRTHGEAYLRP